MEQILAAREVLRQLPSREKEKSRAEVVEFLKGDLRKAVKQGHSLKEIQALLAAQGVNVSLSRMEAVLGQSREKIARKKVQHEELSAEDKDSATANVVRVFAGSDNPGKKFSTEPPS
jgi:bacterioferritin (cytochrome b1)